MSDTAVTPPSLNISIAQINVCVGDLSANTEQIINSIQVARDQYNTDVLVFPELVISGYPPEDLLLRPHFLEKIADRLQEIAQYAQGITVILGTATQKNHSLYNQAVVLADGKVIAEYNKRQLPNYRVFDEKRYFQAGSQPCVVDIAGVKLGVLVCEDIWHSPTVTNTISAGAEALCVLNASPFRLHKSLQRQQLLQQHSSNYACPIIYSNLVGGQDELIFDGESLAYDATGRCVFQAPSFEAGIYVFELAIDQAGQAIALHQDSENASIYQALVLGLRDYVQKNGFSGALLGLSGGIDSALTLAIAVDALGADKVEAVMMPFHYTADISIHDAQQQAETMGVKYREIAIAPMFDAFMDALSSEFTGLAADTTEENIQARSRGVLLMALSNKLGKMLLATGNKSEMSVGYATLYGDMAGGFAPLKDVFKLRVYALSRYRNSIDKEVIPLRVIEREPSAELAPDQIDSDSLPPYDILDDILQRFIEQYQSVEEISATGHDADVVQRVAQMVLLNEYKRRQSAPGIRISQRDFGKDRRYPITSAYRKQL
jgi:NAD+ synthase (glutamine-hydrolysing)